MQTLSRIPLQGHHPGTQARMCDIHKTKRFRLTPEQVAYFKDKYPELGLRQFMAAFKRKFGIELTYLQAKWLGKYYCSGYERFAPSGMYTIKEASFLFDIKVNTLHNLIYKKKLKSRKIGKFVYLHQSEIDKLDTITKNRKQFKPPWPTITCKQAAELLDMNDTTLARTLRQGLVDAVKHDGVWYVRKEHILWARKQLLAGAVNIPWRHLRKAYGTEPQIAPWPAYTTIEAAKILGLHSPSALSHRAKIGLTPAFKHKDVWYLPKLLIDTLAAMRETEGTRLFWKKALNYLKEQGHEFENW